MDEQDERPWFDFEPGWEERWIRAHAQKLRNLRKERRITRHQLADEAGISASQVTRIERGRDARLSTILKLYWGLGYVPHVAPAEPVEEAGDLLTREKWRRLDRRDEGLRRRWT